MCAKLTCSRDDCYSVNCGHNDAYIMSIYYLFFQRKADLLKSGLDEARRERDEKDRKIAVLQARLERTKKNLVMGESEKGAVEEEMDRLNKLLKEKTEYVNRLLQHFVFDGV